MKMHALAVRKSVFCYLSCNFFLPFLLALTPCSAAEWKASIQREVDGSISLSFPSEDGSRYEVFRRHALAAFTQWHRAIKDMDADPSGRNVWNEDEGGEAECWPHPSFVGSRFYTVAIQEDTDGDGLTDAEEKLIYQADPHDETDPHSTELVPIGENTDWQPQDHPENLGIEAVHVDLGEGRLVLDARLNGADDNYRKGEAFLDLRYVPGLEGYGPFDMSTTEISVQVEVPDEFVGSQSEPNGVQVFVKDCVVDEQGNEEWKSQYGAWENIMTGGSHRATLSPTTDEIEGGYTQAGFDPTKIRIIGVKFAIGDGSVSQYEGPLYVTDISIGPGIAVPSPPPLAPTAPPPTFAAGDRIEVRADGFYLNGKRWFIVGGNWRVTEYGQNFGVTAWFPTGNGISKHPRFVEASFEDFRRAGIKVVRVGLLDDGRTMFDEDGHVTGYDDVFRADVRTFLDLAEEANIKVELTLLDYLIAGKGELYNEVYKRGREEIIIDDGPGGVREEFINGVLNPFLDEFGSHPAIIGFDVINEPEWLVKKEEGGGWDDFQPSEQRPDEAIPRDKMKSFIGDCITALRERASGKLVTVGVSSNFASLVLDLDVDYFALHHYPNMGDLSDHLCVLPEGKPWSLEEFPTNDAAPGICEHLHLALNAGGAGAMVWNLSPGIDNRTFPGEKRNAKLVELRTWLESHMPDIY